MSYRPKSAPVKMGESTASKNRRKQQREIDRVNKVHDAKLSAITREAPAKFHAPNGYYSLKGFKAPRVKTDKVDGADPDAPDVTLGLAGNVEPSGHWPHKPDPTPRILREKENFRIKTENKKTVKAFDDKYKVNPDSFMVSNGLGEGKDCRPLFRKRTSLYAVEPAEAPNLVDTGIPKSLGVALCAGCGRKSFYGADGRRMKQCVSCRQVYYCSATCAKIDYESHKVICKYATNGKWHHVRPTEDNWVVNRGMKEARHLLRNKTKMWPDGGATMSIQRRWKAINDKEHAEHARKADIAERARQGLPGPRACMEGC